MDAHKVLAAAAMAVVLAAAGCGTDPPAPPAGDMWCVDRVTQLITEDCNVDADDDGWLDVDIVIPLPGTSRPAVGQPAPKTGIRVAPSRRARPTTPAPVVNPPPAAPTKARPTSTRR